MKHNYHYQSISRLTPSGILFEDNFFLDFYQCEQMENWKGCIALRNIIGKPPYFDFFYPSRNERIRIVFEEHMVFSKSGEDEFHQLYGHLEQNGFHSFDLS